MKKRLICWISAIVVLLNSSSYAAGNITKDRQLPFTGAEQIKMIELSEEDFLGAVTDTSTESSIDIHIQSDEAAFYSYGSNYGYNYLGTMSDGEEMQNCYDTLQAMCTEFCANTANIPSTTYSDGTVVYKLSSDDYRGPLTPDRAAAVYYTFRMDHPEYYWLSSTILYTSLSSGGTRLIPCIYEDYKRYSIRSSLNTIIDENVRNFISSARSVQPYTKYNVIKQIHDDIVSTAVYGYDEDNNPLDSAAAHNIVSVFDGEQNADTVCDGYAKSMQLILNAVGISNMLVMGKANGSNHAWNLAQFDDDNYYYMDVTWDDTTNSYDYFAKGTASFIGTTANKHNPFSPTGTGADFLYELPYVTEEDYIYIEPTEVPTEVPAETASPSPSPLPEDYELNIIFEKQDCENAYLVSLTNRIPDNCHLYVASYNTDGMLLSVGISSESLYTEVSNNAAILKGFVLYDNQKPCINAEVLDVCVTPMPTDDPTETPELTETPAPTEQPSDEPTETPELTETPAPTEQPPDEPTETPELTETPAPTEQPSDEPTETPELTETLAPTEQPPDESTETPEPTETPVPTEQPMDKPTEMPEPTETPAQTELPTEERIDNPEGIDSLLTRLLDYCKRNIFGFQL
ncbi:MAG: hypothetical protein ACI38A_05055 [Candidatus Ornithomonoglobus sp.]